MPSRAAQPQADPTLAALAVLSRFTDRDFDSVDALLESTDSRELVMGLLDVSRMLTNMLGKATDASPETVIDHVRTTVVGLVNSGQLGAGAVKFSSQGR